MLLLESSKKKRHPVRSFIRSDLESASRMCRPPQKKEEGKTKLFSHLFSVLTCRRCVIPRLFHLHERIECLEELSYPVQGLDQEQKRFVNDVFSLKAISTPKSNKVCVYPRKTEWIPFSLIEMMRPVGVCNFRGWIQILFQSVSLTRVSSLVYDSCHWNLLGNYGSPSIIFVSELKEGYYLFEAWKIMDPSMSIITTFITVPVKLDEM